MAAVTAGLPLANGLQPLSCLRCADRKVRCDRRAPCSNCTKHNVICEFPQPRTEKRQRRRTDLPPPSSWGKLRARVERYEDMLRELGVDVDSVSDSPGGSVPNSPMRDHPVPRQKSSDAGATTGRLIAIGRRSRYIEGSLCPRMAEDLYASTVLGDASSDEDEGGAAPDSKTRACRLALGVTPGSQPSTHALYPSQQLFLQLWQTYLSKIHPVTMILHAPSAGETLAEAALDPKHASKDVEALLFATMACAVMSTSETDCTQLYGETRSELLARYLRCSEIGLGKANFLMSSDLGVLQAYTLYLVAISPHADPCELWNMTGIAKRIAQRLGLHQETSSTGLTPFIVEMRRRLWSQIVMYDAMAAQSAGVYRPDTSCDFTPPSNVNDSDLTPSIKHPPMERVGATEMIFCSMRHKVTGLMAEVNGGKRPWALPAGESWTLAVEKAFRAERERAIMEMEEELELEILRYCDMLNPIHFLTTIMARLALCKLQFTVLQPLQHDKYPQGCAEDDRHHIFSAALRVLEYDNNAHSQPSIHGFLWHTQQHFQWSFLIHILKDLKARPSGSQVEKAWQQICMQYQFRPNLCQSSEREPALYLLVNKLATEAWKARESVVPERDQAMAPPAFISTLRQQTHHARPREQIMTTRPSQSLSDQENAELLSAFRTMGQETTGWPNCAAPGMGAPNLSGDGTCFLDPAFNQMIPMSVQAQDAGIYTPLKSLSPLDRHVQVENQW